MHPATREEDFVDLIQEDWQIIESNLHDALSESALMITAGSGTAVEAVALGVSVLIFIGKGKVDPGYLANEGKGIVWQSVNSGEDFEPVLQRLLGLRKNDLSKIQEFTEFYRDKFFFPVNSESIQQAFEL